MFVIIDIGTNFKELSKRSQQKTLTSLWKLIVQVSVVLRKTVGGSD